jgi:uncharacterized NAD(P)/FAD-binding protein YdhS
MSAPRVAIVGGGASGTLLAIQLLRRTQSPLEVVLIEDRPRLGRGCAYDTAEPRHLLNIPAGRMSALPDEPDHFTRWLEGSGVEGVAQRFVPRQLYGLYLEDTLAEACRSARAGAMLIWLQGTAEAITGGGRRVIVRARDGRHTVSAELVAIALGNLPGPAPVPGLAAIPSYIHDPWAGGALEGIAPDDAVLILGTGLTMVDVALSLVSRGHRAPLLALSRHGLLPLSHEARPSPPVEAPPLLALAPRVRLWLRAFREGRVGGGSWRARVDALRPWSSALWGRLDEAERRRFLRHLRPYWDVVRHRMAPAVADAVGALARDGRLQVIAGRVLGPAPPASARGIRIRRRGAVHEELLQIDRVINATGPAASITKARSPLVRRLFSDGLARPDALRLGFDAGGDGRLIDAAGRPSPALFTLGPGLRGLHWETTAIPEIREQASTLAEVWIACLARPRGGAASPIRQPYALENGAE